MNSFERLLILSSVLSLLLWMAAGGWLLARQQERAALREAGTPYRHILTGVRESYEREYVVVSGQKPVGRANLKIQPEKDGSFTVTNDIAAEYRILGIGTEFDVAVRILISPNYDLERFEIQMDMVGQRITVSGFPQETEKGPAISVEVRVADQQIQKMSLPFESGTNFADLLMPLIRTGKPEPGRKWTSSVLDPFTRTSRTIFFQVLDPDDIPGSQGTLSGYPVISTIGDKEFTSFVDETGDVMWEEVPYGFIIVRRDIAEQLGFVKPGEQVGPQPAGRQD